MLQILSTIPLKEIPEDMRARLDQRWLRLQKYPASTNVPTELLSYPHDIYDFGCRELERTHCYTLLDVYEPFWRRRRPHAASEHGNLVVIKWKDQIYNSTTGRWREVDLSEMENNVLKVRPVRFVFTEGSYEQSILRDISWDAFLDSLEQIRRDLELRQLQLESHIHP